MKLVINILLNAFAVIIASYVLPGVRVDGFLTAIVVAIVLGIVNFFIKPLLIILTLPVTILTLGLFLFVINALLILLVAQLVDGFQVNGFFWALLFSLVLSIVSTFLHSLANE
ncbi:MAG: phage holin family protein [Candidatus Levybacteria bacterium]|nr:phage holin family protein [Candidatus Levybacteria bacterium]